ncbi:zinc finger protein-like protein RTS2 [Lepidopterella palustris CBS 459.81]|uniref:Zinc finger protein-like protein RTS2 n=1 Tax=Lepidopterella palustris CBS 459.81 TaxID=1314670 RepID=A0A8E2E8U2_9PEZI|nr:zinc finger protein-like protein RTS2 [Lepidopterella palustris CBS 459.81]
MPRAEIGSTKHLSNKMKSKGLQRLRWYCQVCEKQCRDANGFKCHVQSESHVRQMHVVGEDPKKYIETYSREFQHDFIQLLRTSHGEKPIDVNHFYQEYIGNKEHIHMNATRWPSLTEFAKFLGRQGICTVTEGDKGGLMIAWKDVSPDAVRRREAIRQQEQQDGENDAQEERVIRRMVERARLEAEAKAAQAKAVEPNVAAPKAIEVPTAEATAEEDSKTDAESPPKPESEKVKLNFSIKKPTVAAGKASLGTMKRKSIFKRSRTDTGDEQVQKKVKV